MRETIKAFSAREDEIRACREIEETFDLAFEFSPAALTPETVDETRGYRIVWINPASKIDGPMAERLRENGVRLLVTRSTGTDHFDLAALRKNELAAANVPSYAPSAVAEHTILLVLGCLRHAKRTQLRIEAGDFRIDGLCGRELGALTVGVVGAGSIGGTTVRLLSGFGCRVLVNSRSENAALRGLAEFCGRDRVFAQSDVLIFHCPLTEETHHLVNAETIGRMKDGAVLINTARGGLFDYPAVLAALESGKLSALGFDVYESKVSFVGKSGPDACPDAVFTRLCAMDNVLFTPHIGFYTDTAVSSIIRSAAESSARFLETGHCPGELHG